MAATQFYKATQWRAYFEGLADSHVDINDFRIGGLGTISEQITGLKPPALMAFFPRMGVDYVAGAAPLDLEGSIAVIVKIAGENEAEKTTALEQAQDILLEVVAKIRHDAVDDTNDTYTGKVSFGQVIPQGTQTFGDNYIGANVPITIEDRTATLNELDYNAAKWT